MVPDQDKWEWLPIINGIQTLKIKSWKYFIDFTYEHLLDHETYIWRGQRNENWPLESTLGRLIKDAKVAKTKQWDFKQSHLEQFKYAVRGRRGANPPQISTENEWWALGQHHGLATPLLDWTLSPFVAAYFAYINTGEPQTSNRAIYALHKPSIEGKAAEIVRNKQLQNRLELEQIASGIIPQNALRKGYLKMPVNPEIEFVRPLSDDNQRLVNQGGLFSTVPVGHTIESWINTNFPAENHWILLKIFVPDKDRAEALKTLNRMNINHLTLFPDLFGASKFCNLYGEIEKY